MWSVDRFLKINETINCSFWVSDMKKYEIVKSEAITVGTNELFRIRALIDIPNVVKVGQLGGYIESEGNLSHDGNCWIMDDAWVYEDARVSGNAVVMGSSKVYGRAIISNDATVEGKSTIFGSARIIDSAHIFDSAFIWGECEISGDSLVTDHVEIAGRARVSGDVWIKGCASICGDAVVDDAHPYLCVGPFDDSEFVSAHSDSRLGVRLNWDSYSGSVHGFVQYAKDECDDAKIIERHKQFASFVTAVLGEGMDSKPKRSPSARQSQ